MKLPAIILLLLGWSLFFCGLVLITPIASDDIGQTFTNESVKIKVLQNDVDPDGDLLTRPLPLSFPHHGRISLNNDMSINYQPDSGFVGRDSFRYEVCDIPASGPITCDDANVELIVCPESRYKVSPQIYCQGEDVVFIPIPESPNPNNQYSWDFGPGANPQTITGLGPHTVTYSSPGVKIVYLTTTYPGTPCYHVAYTSIFIKGEPFVEISRVPVSLCIGDTGVFEAMDTLGTGDFAWDFGGGANPATANGPGPHKVVYSTHGEKEITLDGENAGCISSDREFIGVEKLCCIDFQISAFLEGPFIPLNGKMTTIINDFGFLPGETPQVGLFPVPTPTGQPYNTEPWLYDGGEGDAYGDGPGQIPYPASVTDWVLVSLRKGGNLPSDEVFKQAALLHDDGEIEFVGPCFSTIDSGPYWVVVEHRNHMGVMSDVALTINFAGPEPPTIEYDFRERDSFRDLFTSGQKEIGGIGSGVYGFFGGDVEKAGIQNFEINGADRSIWLNNNGRGETYNPGDFTLNVEVNGNDNSVWLRNNGVASSVPK